MKTNTSKLIKVLGLSIVIVLNFSCANYDKANAEQIALEETGETALLNAFQAKEPVVSETEKVASGKTNSAIKIIRNATCKIKVNHVEDATRQVKTIASRYHGYVSEERFTNTNYSKENRFTIRIPQDAFDHVLDSISKLAEYIDHKNISTIDVTEEYVDITSRLKTKFEVKKRYEDILRSKAKTVEDILKAEDKLKNLQEEIESAQGRLNYLSNKVAYSTIQVDMYEVVVPKEEPALYEPGFLDKAKNGWSFGWSLVENSTLLLFYIWPFLIFGALIFVYFKWIKKQKL